MRTHKQKSLPLKVAGYIFGIVAIAHLLRSIFNLEITVAGHLVPMSISYVGFVISFLLSIWMFKASNHHHKRGF